MERSAKAEQRLLGFLLLLSSALLLLGSLYFQDLQITLGVFVGCLIGFANGWLYTLIVRGLTGNPGIGPGRVLLAISLKLLILFVIIGLILLKSSVRPLPLLVGVSNIFIAIMLYALKDIKPHA